MSLHLLRHAVVALWVTAALTATAGRASAQALSEGPRAEQLRLEIDDLRQQEAGISQGGPAVMMIFGYVFAPLILVGPVLLIADGSLGCDIDDSSCPDLFTPGLVITGLGLAGVAVGLTGIFMAVERADQRRYLRGRITDKERELGGLTLSLDPSTRAAALQLRATF